MAYNKTITVYTAIQYFNNVASVKSQRCLLYFLAQTGAQEVLISVHSILESFDSISPLSSFSSSIQ